MRTKAKLNDDFSERERQHRELSFLAAIESIVLLENNGVLPLSPKPIALFGAGARYTIAGGTGSGEVNVRHNVTIEEGLTNAGFEILTTDWMDRYEKLWKEGKEKFLAYTKRKLLWPTTRRVNDMMATEYRFPAGDLISENELQKCNSDTCIYVLARQSGEGHDLMDINGSFRMDNIEIQNIQLCAEKFKHFILVINTGCPIDLTPVENINSIQAIVYMGQLGMEGGNALAAVITGQYTPSGKLAVSWPKKYEDVPFSRDFAKQTLKAQYKEGIYVGYRYYDSFDIAPRYPFGFGQTYTSFNIQKTQVSCAEKQVNCLVTVANIGDKYAGKEIIQIYARCPGNDKEHQRLVAFAKTDYIKPNDKQTLVISFPIETLASFNNENAQTILDAGKYLICVGTSSRLTTPVAALVVQKQTVIEQHKHLCQPNKQITELRHQNKFEIPYNIPEYIINTDEISYCQSKAQHQQKNANNTQIQNLSVQHLSAEECIKICVGTGMDGSGKGFCTPGAVGHTTADFISKGWPNREMCDGPAGLRINKRAVLYPNGEIKPLDMPISVYEYFPDFFLKYFMLGNPNKGKILYQNVTSFPVEAMIAQTWNVDIAKNIGRAVSIEMEEYGVSVWLAPAMNIVRNPLCGRNYEYFSEDPMLTAKMAVNTTIGLQENHNTWATLKHFCANNQETERFHVSSEVDERTLREIYWKAFELTVKEAEPKAIMLAYNKLNGIYCAENYELCTQLLRNEWHFNGITMTDWMATEKGRAIPAKCINAGIDLIMPGTKDDIKALTIALKNGDLTLAQLLETTTRIITTIIQ